MKKVLHQTVQIGADVLSGEDRAFCLDYYLTKREYDVTDAIAALCYGVRIEKRYFGESAYAESTSADSLFLSEQSGLDLLEFLSQHSVTPVSLNEVLEDLHLKKAAC